MATRLFSTLVPTIAAHAPGCPTPTIIKYVRDAAIEACERTLYWRYRTDSFALTPLQSTYNYADAINPGGGGAGAITTVTMDPNYSNALGTLSGGNLSWDWAYIGSFGCTYATVPRSTGKYYFEIVNTQPGGYGGAIYDNWSLSGGIAVTRNISNDVLVGTASDAWGFANSNPSGLSTKITTYNNSVGTTYNISQIPQDGYLGVAVDLDAGKVWFDANGTWVNSGNPVAGTGQAYSFSANPTVYPAMGQGSYNPFGGSTINFGATPWEGTLPTGYTPWNTSSGGGGGGGGIQNAVVHAVFGAAFVDGPALRPLTLEAALQQFPQWDAASQASQPQAFCQLNTTQYIVLPKPETGSAYTITLTVALKPTKDATGMDEDVFNELEDVIVHNTLQRLLILPNQNWSDRESAGYHARQYLFKLTERRARANLGNMRGSMSVRLPPFGA